jgi:hypothetical protein
MLVNLKLNQTKAIMLLLSIFFIQMLCYNYQRVFVTHPNNVHSWRQTDCLSFALNFYNGRATFTQPCVNNLGNTGDGKAASDFPLVQYTVAKIWKITGKSELVFRLIETACLLLGLLSIFKLVVYWTKNYMLAILVSSLIYTSPILAYYGPTFLSDIQAFGLSCAGFYFTIKWLTEKKTSYLLISTTLFLFAGWCKMSAGFLFLIALVLIFIDVIKNYRGYSKKQLYMLPILAIPFLCWYAWFSYAYQYNQQHVNGFFLVGILPFWKVDHARQHEIFQSLFTYIFPQMFDKTIFLGTIIFAVTFILLKIKQVFSKEYLILLFSLGLFIAFIMLFFDVFGVHDYYMINMIALISIMVCVIAKVVQENSPLLLNNKLVYGFLFTWLGLLTYQTAVKNRARVGSHHDWGKSLVFNKQEVEGLNYSGWYDASRYEVLENRSFHVSDYGISKNDTVLCLGDYTINRALYLTDCVGYSNFNVGMDDIDRFIEEKKKKGLKYIILIEPDFLNNLKLKPYLTNKLFHKKSTSIYRL